MEKQRGGEFQWRRDAGRGNQRNEDAILSLITFPRRLSRKGRRERSGEGVIRRSEMCDDVESTKWFRPIAVQSGAYDGQVTIFISGPVLFLLQEMLRRKNLKELFFSHWIPPLQAIICVEPCWGDTTDPGEPVLISQCLYFSPAIPLLQTAEPFESAMAYGLSSV